MPFTVQFVLSVSDYPSVRMFRTILGHCKGQDCGSMGYNRAEEAGHSPSLDWIVATKCTFEATWRGGGYLQNVAGGMELHFRLDYHHYLRVCEEADF